MKKRLSSVLLFIGLFTVSVQAEESVISDQAAIARCRQVIFSRAGTLEQIRTYIMEAVPPERRPFWDDLLPALGSSLNQRHDEALSRFARLLIDHPRSAIGDLNHVFLLRLHGVALGKSGDYSTAIQVYDDLVRQYNGNPEPDIQRQVAYAMNHLAVTFGKAGDFEAQIRTFDALIDAFENTADTDMQNFVIASWFMKSLAYHEEGYPDEGRRTFQEMERTFPGVMKNPDAIHIASTFCFVNENQADEPIDTLPKEVKAQLGQLRPTPSPEEAEAGNMILKAMLLNEQNDPKAITLYDEVIARYRDSKNGRLQNDVAHAMISKAVLLERLGKGSAAVEAYRDFELWAGTEKAPEVQNAIAMGMFFKGTFLGRAGDRRGAIGEYDKMIVRFKGVDDDSVQERVATALSMKAKMFDELGDPEAAYAVVTELIETYGRHSFFGARNIAEYAEPLRKKLIRQLGKVE